MRLWALLILAGCGGDDDPAVPVDTAPTVTDTDTETTDKGPKTELKYTADWQGVLDLLDDRCAGCHAGPITDTPFPELFEADLESLEGEYIVPFDPDGSTLWRVLADELEPGDFASMPWVPGPLKERFIDHVRIWIEAGAPSPYTAEPDDLDVDGDGYSINEGDCDDDNEALNPAAEELCDGLDTDCDGDIPADELDGDSDGYSGCRGDCDDVDSDRHPFAGDPVDGVDNDCDGLLDEGYTFSFAADIQPIIDDNCIVCHAPPLVPAYMDLTVDAYAEIVGVASAELPAMNRIEPADPSQSYLWHKVEGTHLDVGGLGERMPQYGPYLSQPVRDVIEGWIHEGARP